MAEKGYNRIKKLGLESVRFTKLDEADKEGYRYFSSIDEWSNYIKSGEEVKGDLIIIEGSVYQVEEVPMNGSKNTWVSVDDDLNLEFDSETGEYEIKDEELDVFRIDGFTYYYSKED